MTILRAAKVVAFGDSITRQSPKLQWRHWLDIVQERFRLRLVNAGVNGNHTRKALERIGTDVLEHRPDLVLICFGMNDHVMRSRNTPHVLLSEFRGNLKRMASLIRDIGAEPVLIAPNPIVEGDPEAPGGWYYSRHNPAWYEEAGGAQSWLDQYIEAIREVGRDGKIGLADVRRASEAYDPRLLTTDGVHLSELGHRVYAEVVGGFLANEIIR